MHETTAGVAARRSSLNQRLITVGGRHKVVAGAQLHRTLHTVAAGRTRRPADGSTRALSKMRSVCKQGRPAHSCRHPNNHQRCTPSSLQAPLDHAAPLQALHQIIISCGRACRVMFIQDARTGPESGCAAGADSQALRPMPGTDLPRFCAHCCDTQHAHRAPSCGHAPR